MDVLHFIKRFRIPKNFICEQNNFFRTLYFNFAQQHNARVLLDPFVSSRIPCKWTHFTVFSYCHEILRSWKFTNGFVCEKRQLLEVKLFGHRFNCFIYIIHIFTDCLDEGWKREQSEQARKSESGWCVSKCVRICKRWNARQVIKKVIFAVTPHRIVIKHKASKTHFKEQCFCPLVLFNLQMKRERLLIIKT